MYKRAHTNCPYIAMFTVKDASITLVHSKAYGKASLPQPRHCLVGMVTLLSESESGADEIETRRGGHSSLGTGMCKVSHVSVCSSLPFLYSLLCARLCEVFCCLNDT